MDAAALAAFLAVTEHGSFSRAAEQLHLTQSAVSKRISTLESLLGVALFDRLGHTIVLTEAGRVLLPRAQQLLRDIGDSRRALANLSGQVSGTLSVATSHHVGLHRLPPVLRTFVETWPQVKLDLRFMASEAAGDAVLRGEVELAIITLPLKCPPPLLAEPLWTDVLRVAITPRHPLATRKKITPFMLIEHPAILPELGTFTRALIEDAFEPLELKPRVVLSTNYLETIKMMVSVGLGWSLLPISMLDHTLASPFLTGLHIERRLGVIRHSGHTLSNAAQTMLAQLHEVPRKK
ncbi:MAG: LysR family transcriptional regulator [Burkholderiales bacterium]|jgi:DNA-binding transcriptional LysR family regulator|nr:LysR family transcriptional regulator [Burkholderiales bacterium]